MESSWPNVESVFTDLKTDLTGAITAQTDVLRRIESKVDGKADRADLVRVEGRVDVLEDERNSRDAVRRFKHRAWAAAGVVAGIVAAAVGSVTAFH